MTSYHNLTLNSQRKRTLIFQCFDTVGWETKWPQCHRACNKSCPNNS